MLFGSGFANACGQYFWTQALRLAPATAVSPFYYLMLVWALIIGFLVWGDMPTKGLLDRVGYRRCLRAVPALARSPVAALGQRRSAGSGENQCALTETA